MSRGNASTARCVAVWLAATAALAATGRLVGATAATLGQSATWQRSFEDLLVAVCAAALLACGARLWVVTTATTVGLVRGQVSREASPGLTRRLVLAACGAAVVAGVATPAVAGQGGDPARLAGLPLPDRATASSPAQAGAAPSLRTAPVAHRPPAAVRHEAAARDQVVVRSGDSLWSLAADRLPRSAGPAAIDRAWREVYAANRAEIGADPGLIRPGQRLHLPATAERDDR